MLVLPRCVYWWFLFLFSWWTQIRTAWWPSRNWCNGVLRTSNCYAVSTIWIPYYEILSFYWRFQYRIINNFALSNDYIRQSTIKLFPSIYLPFYTRNKKKILLWTITYMNNWLSQEEKNQKKKREKYTDTSLRDVIIIYRIASVKCNRLRCHLQKE